MNDRPSQPGATAHHSEDLRALATRAWELHAGASAHEGEPVCSPSMPILYFGDYRAYNRSPLRAVTVGLNPSLVEFPATDPWCRFPGGELLLSPLAGGATDTYLDLLDAYFKMKPYDGWFRQGFEPLLRGLRSSFYRCQAESTALHTDLCTPLATSPTWTDLGQSQGTLREGGLPLWRDLITALRPHVIVISVAQRYLSSVTPIPLEDWDVVYTVERDRPYHVRATRIRVGDWTSLAIFGRAAQLPFGTISHSERVLAGAATRSMLDG